jgi:hypothetical protein
LLYHVIDRPADCDLIFVIFVRLKGP